MGNPLIPNARAALEPRLTDNRKTLMLFAGRAHPSCRAGSQRADVYVTSDVGVRQRRDLRASRTGIRRLRRLRPAILPGTVNRWWLMEQLIMIDALKTAAPNGSPPTFYPYARQDKKYRGCGTDLRATDRRPAQDRGRRPDRALSTHTDQIQGF